MHTNYTAMKSMDTISLVDCYDRSVDQTASYSPANVLLLLCQMIPEQVEMVQEQVRQGVGDHICKHIWRPLVGEVLTLEREEGNNHDKFAVSLLKDATGVGHVPREFSRVFWNVLGHRGTITCEVTRRVKDQRYPFSSFFVLRVYVLLDTFA